MNISNESERESVGCREVKGKKERREREKKNELGEREDEMVFEHVGIKRGDHICHVGEFLCKRAG